MTEAAPATLSRLDELVAAVCTDATPLKRKCDCINKIIEMVKKQPEEIQNLTRHVPLSVLLSKIRGFLVQSSVSLKTLSLKFLRLLVLADRTTVQEICRRQVDHFIARCIDSIPAPNPAIPSQTSNSGNGAGGAGGNGADGNGGGNQDSLGSPRSGNNQPSGDQETNTSRMAALKLAYTMATNEPSGRFVPLSIVEALKEVARTPEDHCCRVALDTLTHFTIRNPEAAAGAAVLPIIVEAIISPHMKALQDGLLMVVLFLLDSAETRVLFSNLSYIYAPLTGSHFPDAMEILNLSTRALTVMLKTWPGLFWAARNGAASALVSALEHQDSRVVSVVLDSLFEIFRVPQVGSANPFQKHDPVVLQADDADSVTGPASLNLSSGDSSSERSRNSRKQNVINNYLSVLLLTFIDVGLIEALTNLGSSSEVEVDRIKVTMLLAELLYLSNMLLPPSLCARIQQTPVLVKKAVSFRLDAQLRSRASTMVTNLHKYTNLKASHQEVLLQSGGSGSSSARRIKDFRLARIDEVRRKIDWDIDDQTLLQMLRQTQVTQLGTKDWSRWKWDAIVELLDGPLSNPALLSTQFLKSGSTLSNNFTKFLKRLLSFYRPSKKLFSELSWQYENMIYVRAGTALLELLTDSDGGREYLTNHALLKNLSDVLAAEVLKKEGAAGAMSSSGSGAAAAANAATAAAAAAAAQSGIPAGFFWSHERMLRTMAREYFPLLGVLTRSTSGLAILNSFGIMTRLRALCEKSNRDDLVHLILTSLDYDQKSECISILNVGLTNPKSPVVRYLATRHMRHLLRQRSADFENWGIEFLHERVTLPDPEPKVRNLALQILDEACDDEQAMLKLITSKAMLYNEQLGGAGRALQIRFLSLPQGFQYLQEIGWIHSELEKWVASENAAYVEAIEKKISGVLNRPLNRRVTGSDGPSFLSTYNTDDEVFIVPHFFGELAKTQEGCKFIKRSNVVPKFIKLLTKTGSATGQSASSLERRAAMWALGHISCSSTGFELLESHNVTQIMVDLAENASSLSIRGTAIYILGMMSAAPQVREKLHNLGWECPVDISGASGRLALPIQGIISKMFHVDADDVKPVRFADVYGRVMWALPEKGPAAGIPRAYSSPSSSTTTTPAASAAAENGTAAIAPAASPTAKEQDNNDLRSEILTNVANLSNHVSAEPAQRTLRRIKAKNPDAFTDPVLVFEIFKILEHLTFRLKQRRFLGELFDDVAWTDDAFKTIEKLFPPSQFNSSSLYR